MKGKRKTVVPKVIILDRDGVILCHVEKYILKKEDVSFIPGSIEAIQQLLRRGIKIAVVSNQSPISRKLVNQEFVSATNSFIKATIGCENKIKFYICPHTDKDNCFCRKPKNGLIKQVMVDYGVESDECWLIGDADTDILAGTNSGISHNYQVLSGRQDKPCGLQKGTFKNLKELVENFEKLAEDEYGK